MSVGQKTTSIETGVNDLTPRQRQILALIQAGKVNKEVARELGIEEGTVKQHVVAIFKKLNVSNRTMAVGKLQQQDLSSNHNQQGDEVDRTQLERRPCIVLALALPLSVDDSGTRRFLGLVAELATSYKAVFLARRNHACEVIFGVHRVHESDAVHALEMAQKLYQTLSHKDANIADQFCVAIVTGVVLASLDRYGGWTEEVIASPAIAAARRHLSLMTQGGVMLSLPFLELLRVQKISFSTVFQSNQPQPWSSFHWMPFLSPSETVASICQVVRPAAQAVSFLQPSCSDEQLAGWLQMLAKADNLVLDDRRLAYIVSLAAGVPFYARELLRHGSTDGLPLSLLIHITALVDYFKLDRCLLRALVVDGAYLELSALVDNLSDAPLQVRQALGRLIAVGLVREDEQGFFQITHPLIKSVLRYLMVHSMSISDL